MVLKDSVVPEFLEPLHQLFMPEFGHASSTSCGLCLVLRGCGLGGGGGGEGVVGGGGPGWFCDGSGRALACL